MIVKKLASVSGIMKKADKRYKTYRDRLVLVMPSLGFDRKETEMYRILLRDKLRINGLQRRLHVSERTARRYVKEMFSRGFIKRKVIEGKRLAYEYASVSPAEVWKNLRSDIMKNIEAIDGFLNERMKTRPENNKSCN